MSAAGSAARVGQKFTVLGRHEFRGETTLVLARADIKDVCRYCKQALGFDYLVDISSVDNFGEEPRFEVVYHLYAMERGEALRLKIYVSEDELEAPTVTDLWATADWHEREVFDMMGIRFAGHPNLCRILMWDGYPFHPLRKDFPLAGKASEVPGVAFTRAAPLAGGPFVTVPSAGDTQDREPRSRSMRD